MDPKTESAQLTPTQRKDFVALLTPENLSALMRSTWTWDDRALRRTLSDLLVDLAAVRELHVGDVECPTAVVEAAEARVLATAGEFIAEVLGPRLLADTGNPFREPFLPLVSATSSLWAAADRALDTIALDVTGRVIERNESLAAILPEDKWTQRAFDGSPIGLAKVSYSAGYTLSSTDYFASAGLAAQAFRIAASPTESVELERSALAAAEKTGSWDPALVKTRALPVADGWQITGEKWYVPGADRADTLLVIARTTGGPSLYLVERSAPGVSVDALDSLDPTRPLFRVSFSDTPARLIGREGAGGRTMNRTVDRSTTALSGEQMGIVDRALKELSTVPPSCADDDSWRRYTRQVAELEVLRAGATALWYHAVRTQGGDDLDAAGVAAAMAHIGCSTAARQVSLHLSSATAEIDPATAEHIQRRARSTDLLLGGPALAHERMLERLGI